MGATDRLPAVRGGGNDAVRARDYPIEGDAVAQRVGSRQHFALPGNLPDPSDGQCSCRWAERGGEGVGSVDSAPHWARNVRLG